MSVCVCVLAYVFVLMLMSYAFIACLHACMFRNVHMQTCLTEGFCAGNSSIE